MTRLGWRWLRAACALTAMALASPALAETRLGLVLGNAGYPNSALKTAANDGALISETLRSVGFDVTEGRDLDQTSLRRAVRDFAAKIDAAGDDTVVFVYYAGHALQAGGANHLVPIDARLERLSDATAETFSLDALLRDLGATKSRMRFVVVDAATELPFVAQVKLARGLALADAAPGSLIAFAASPGEIMPAQADDYGVYALALLEMLREPGLSPEEIFNRVKLRVHEKTKGAVTPMFSSALGRDFRFLERAEPAPPVSAAPDPRALTMAQLDAASAYALALERDTLKAYQDFIAVYPGDPLAKKVRAKLAKKREALAWRRATQQRTREAYWTYRKWYPRGPHYEEAGYELIALAAPLAPPSGFAEVVWEEIEAPVVEEYAYFDDVVPAPLAYADIAPPPLPIGFLPPTPVYFVAPPPPAPAPGLGLLPMVGLAAVPAVAILPRIVRPPPPRILPPGGALMPRPGAILPRPVVAPGGPIVAPPGGGPIVPPPLAGRPPIVTRPGRPPIVAPLPGGPPVIGGPGRPGGPIVRPGRRPGPVIVTVPPRGPIVRPPRPERPVVIRPRPGRPDIVMRPPRGPIVRERPPIVRGGPPIVRGGPPIVRGPGPVVRGPVVRGPVGRAPGGRCRPGPFGPICR